MKHAGNIWLFFALTALIPLSIYGVVSWYEEHQLGLPVLGGKENGSEHGLKIVYPANDFLQATSETILHLQSLIRRQ